MMKIKTAESVDKDEGTYFVQTLILSTCKFPGS
jgi:hypothetical protein